MNRNKKLKYKNHKLFIEKKESIKNNNIGFLCIKFIAEKYYHTNIKEYINTENSEISNLKSLCQYASCAGFEFRYFFCSKENISKLQETFIIEKHNGDYDIILKNKKNTLIVFNPLSNKREINKDDFFKIYNGLIIDIWKKVKFKKEKNKIDLISLFKNAKGVNLFIFKLFSFSIAIELINILLPIGTQLIMDHVLLSKDINLLIVICIGLFSFLLFKTFSSILRNWLSIIMEELIDIKWKHGLFIHLLNLPLYFFEKHKLGDIENRFESLEKIKEIFTKSIVQGIIDIIMISFVSIMMIMYGGWLFIIAILFIVLNSAVRIITYNYYEKALNNQIKEVAKSHSYFMETLYGIATVKVLGINKLRASNWLNINIIASNYKIKLKKFNLIFNELITFTTTLEQIIILGLGAYAVIEDKITIGMYVAFNAYRWFLSDRIANFIETAMEFAVLSVHNKRISEIAFAETEDIKIKNNDYLKKGSVTFDIKGIYFGYKTTGQIISNLNLSFIPGECVAITGHSGIGKTTLMKIMVGLIKPKKGKILFNGIDIYEMGINNYRKYISCILQDDQLFSGSISDNICGFSEEKDLSFIEECAKISNIHTDIIKLPDGYETNLSELGDSLSGGQKQRLFIARALYRRPVMLFMDEATSHLDTENEKNINDAISALKITRIIIAHRISTIESAHRVINLNEILKH